MCSQESVPREHCSEVGTKFTWCSPASAIDLDPGISLNPGSQVGFLCLLEYPSAVLTSSVESVLLEDCRIY